MEIAPEMRPRLRPGCRLSAVPGQENVLLVPEGLMKLSGPARPILELCDGHHTFAQISAALQAVYPAAAAKRIEHETAAYLERLRDRGAVEF